ncbi:hypothetical protein AGMMS49938_15460 [Fibrobacterales bacterium]|nr:hypothetical protein AGMMS49938_15460 [Fibrobacterales bacterium]
MRINVKVQPKSSQEKVEVLPNGSYKVFVHSPPADGEANGAVVKVLAEYFKKAKSGIQIISGNTSRNKIVEVE